MTSRWIPKSYSGFGPSYYVEVATPTEREAHRRRAQLKRLGRLLVVVGAVVTAVLLAPGVIAGIATGAATPIVVIGLLTVAVWAGAIVAWRRIVDFLVARPQHIERSLDDYERFRAGHGRR